MFFFPERVMWSSELSAAAGEFFGVSDLTTKGFSPIQEAAETLDHHAST